MFHHLKIANTVVLDNHTIYKVDITLFDTQITFISFEVGIA